MLSGLDTDFYLRSEMGGGSNLVTFILSSGLKAQN